jgi:Homing endonuclease associated repeat
MVHRWSKDEIGLEILRLFAAGEELNYGSVQQKHLKLLRAATRYFGSWKDAIEFAGLNYDEIRRYRVWTEEKILSTIRKYEREGKDLSWRHVSTVLDPPLAAAAIRSGRFGSWQKALEEAGLDYDTIRKHRYWDDEIVVNELRELAEQGQSLRVSDVTEMKPALVAAARRRFDGWYEAVEAAGFDEDEARRGAEAAGRFAA